MSIVSMVDNQVLQKKRDPKEAADPGAPAGVPANVVNQLVAWIPTEVITVWVALLAVINDPKPPQGKALCQADWHVHWLLAFGAALLAAALAVGLAYRKGKDAGLKRFAIPWFATVAAPAAFLAWAIALPEGPLRSACWYTEEAGAFIVTIATVGIATAAYILGQGARYEKA